MSPVIGFGVPILNRVAAPGDAAFESLARPGKPQALAVAPTRELAVQVSGDLERAGKRRGVRVLTVYGGRAYEPQIEALRKQVEALEMADEQAVADPRAEVPPHY